MDIPSLYSRTGMTRTTNTAPPPAFEIGSSDRRAMGTRPRSWPTSSNPLSRLSAIGPSSPTGMATHPPTNSPPTNVKSFASYGRSCPRWCRNATFWQTRRPGSLKRRKICCQDFQFIRAHQTGFPISAVCRIQNVLTDGYYAWCTCPLSEQT